VKLPPKKNGMLHFICPSNSTIPKNFKARGGTLRAVVENQRHPANLKKSSSFLNSKLEDHEKKYTLVLID